MKKFTKLMLATAAVTAVSTAMAVSAMAADITGTYNPETGVVSLDGVDSRGDQQTLLVLTEDANEITDDNAKDIIAQIDQDASITSFKLKKGLTEGTYYIRMGGSDGQIQKGILTLDPNPDKTVTIVIGDIDKSEDVTISDVTALARGNAGKKQAKYKNEWVGDAYKVKSVTSGNFEGTTLVIGDIDQSDDVTISDVTALARGNAGKIQSKYKNECVGAVVEAVADAQ